MVNNCSITDVSMNVPGSSHLLSTGPEDLVATS